MAETMDNIPLHPERWTDKAPFLGRLFRVRDYCRNGHTGAYTLVTPQGKQLFRSLLIHIGIDRAHADIHKRITHACVFPIDELYLIEVPLMIGDVRSRKEQEIVLNRINMAEDQRTGNALKPGAEPVLFLPDPGII